MIPSDIIAEEGDDIMPHYLPDGRIVFSSTRQRQSQAILLDEGKPQFEAQDEDRQEPAFVLHVMNADGSDIHQISFNQSHDFDPSVLDNGRIMFSRWDHAGGKNGFNLYADATRTARELELLYGAQSHVTGTNGSDIEFLDPRPADDGKIMARAQPFTAGISAARCTIIDVANYVENTQPTLANRGVLTGPAQTPATRTSCAPIEGPSPGGRFSSAFPLWDGTGRVLVSWIAVPPARDRHTRSCRARTTTSPRRQPCRRRRCTASGCTTRRRQTQLPVVTPTGRRHLHRHRRRCRTARCRRC